MASQTTDRLELPYLMPAQAQKHVTVNEALRKLDALVQPRVLSRAESAEPAAPAAGDAYVLPAGASGAAWDGFAEHDLAVFQDGAWEAFAPQTGWQVFDAGAEEVLVFDGTAWRTAGELTGQLDNLTRLGIGTTADAANPFSARLNAALWTALESGQGGTGDLRYTLNKEGPANVLSVLFQSGWSGRAEMGLIGGENFAVKVSEDGASWVEAIRVNGNGRIGFNIDPEQVDSSFVAEVNLWGSVSYTRILDSSGGANNQFIRARGTLANPAALIDGDRILIQKGIGYDGTNFKDAVQMRFEVDAAPAQDIVPTRVTFHTTNASGARSEQVRIDRDGNLGLGTSAPTHRLDVNADSMRIRLSRTPASATDDGAPGEIAWDSAYLYVCVAADSWKRAALASW